MANNTAEPTRYLITGPNWLGMWTLYRREVMRFAKIWNQTLVAPVITTLLWLAILTLALGGSRGGGVHEIPFQQFVVPGLTMMAMVQNAFGNTSSSLVLSKMQGVIVDLLMPPLSADEVTFGMVAGGITRGIVVGLVVGAAVSIFVHVPMPHPFLALFYMVMASTMLSLIGMLTGIWGHNFEQVHAVTNYVITPLAFLSGTFYSVRALPGIWHTVSYMNPFFYMIDGFRFATVGYHDGDIMTGAVFLIVVNIILWLITRALVAKGWRLKT